MTVPPAIWLADLARACAALDVTTAAERERVAELLGLGGSTAQTSRDVVVPPSSGTPEAPFLEIAARVPGPGATAGPSEEATAATRGRPVPPAAEPDLLPVAWRDPVAAAGWEVAALARSAAEAPVRPRPGLLAPRSAPAILRALIQRQAPDGEPDLPAVIRRVGSGLAITGLPRVDRPALRHGVQVLVDLGQGMEPYAEDQADLVDQITGLVGAELTDVRYFADAPLRGAGPGPGWTWHDYRPPTGRTRLLILSDLGIGGFPGDQFGARQGEWLAFARLTGAAAVTPVVLVPYPPWRWPAWADGPMRLVQWDRRTDVSTALRRVGRS